MLKYSFMKLGVPASEKCRVAMLSHVKFNIGGHLFSLQEWLDGILRGNRKSPVTKNVAFGKSDPRLALASNLGETFSKDCRVHFAIHCWARSRRSPPVKIFTAEGIHAELALVAQAFCEEDDNVAFNVCSKQMRLSEPFRCYKADFVDIYKTSVPRLLLNFLHGSRKIKLERFFHTKKSMKLTCRCDDWTMGTGDFVAFDTDLLSANVKKLRKCVRSTTSPASPVQNKDSPPGKPRNTRGISSGSKLLLNISATRKNLADSKRYQKADRPPAGPLRRRSINDPRRSLSFNDKNNDEHLSGRTLPLDLDDREQEGASRICNQAA